MSTSTKEIAAIVANVTHRQAGLLQRILQAEAIALTESMDSNALEDLLSIADKFGLEIEIAGDPSEMPAFENTPVDNGYWEFEIPMLGSRPSKKTEHGDLFHQLRDACKGLRYTVPQILLVTGTILSLIEDDGLSSEAAIGFNKMFRKALFDRYFFPDDIKLIISGNPYLWAASFGKIDTPEDGMYSSLDVFDALLNYVEPEQDSAEQAIEAQVHEDNHGNDPDGCPF